MQESMPGVNEVRPPASLEGEPNAGTPDEPLGDDPRHLADPRVLQILMTEHWGLLATRSLAYNETFARAGMFFTTLSASVVALALIVAALGPGPDVLMVAIVLVLFDVLIGLTTLGRVNDASTEDLRCIQGMNRLRNAYHEVAPMIEPYLSTSRYDDLPGVLYTYASGETMLGPLEGVLHGLTTVPAMVNAVTMLLVAVLAGLIAAALGAGIVLTLAVGVIAFAVAAGLSLVAAGRAWRAMETELDPRFPSPPPDPAG